MPDLSTRPATACQLCPPPAEGKPWRRPDDGYRTCSDCLNRLRADLLDISRRYLLLDPRPGAGSDHHGRGAPGYGSRPPASPHIITMTDHRSKGCEVSFDTTVYVWDPLADTTLEPGQYGPPAGAYVEKRDVWIGADGRAHTEQENPPRSVPTVLGGLAQLVAEERDIRPPRDDVHELCRWLDQHLDWITRGDLVADFAADIRALLGQLKPVTGEPGRRHIGLCPNLLDDEHGLRECGARLYAPLRGDTIKCNACSRQWPRREWLRLGDLLEAS